MLVELKTNSRLIAHSGKSGVSRVRKEGGDAALRVLELLRGFWSKM